MRVFKLSIKKRAVELTTKQRALELSNKHRAFELNTKRRAFKAQHKKGPSSSALNRALKSNDALTTRLVTKNTLDSDTELVGVKVTLT